MQQNPAACQTYLATFDTSFLIRATLILTTECIDHFEFFVDDPEKEICEDADHVSEIFFHSLPLYFPMKIYNAGIKSASRIGKMRVKFPNGN